MYVRCPLHSFLNKKGNKGIVEHSITLFCQNKYSIVNYRGCSNFKSKLSTDDQMMCSSICNFQRLLHEFRSIFGCIVQLCIYLSCSTVEPC